MNVVLKRANIFLISTLLSFIFSELCYSQNKYTLPQITPQTPNQASLGKYGDVPVSLNTGMINMQVPLFSIKSGSIEIPITLTYHNNGLKVDEIPSWVGLGWDLRAGGAINFEQRGNPDFSLDGDGMFTSSTYNSGALLNSYLTNQMTAQQKYDYLEKVISGDVDSEYDLYHYNFGNYSGSFYFDKNQNIINVPKSNLKITSYNGGYKFVDEKGNQYLFITEERTTMNPSPLTGLETRKSFNDNASFLLTQIITIENRTINFEYIKYPTGIFPLTYFKQGAVFTKYGGLLTTDPCNAQYCPSGSNYNTYNTEYTMENHLLSSITFDEGSVQFEVSNVGREDIKKISPNQNLPYLRKVKLLNNQNVIVNEFTLNSSYFGNNDRLKLDEVVHTNGNLNNEKWVFDYYGQTESFPAFFSKRKDHWGYYNGANNSQGIPRANYASFISPWSNDANGYVSANRASNFNYGLIGVLKTIKYPTGGHSLFEYEGNKVVYPSFNSISNPFLLADVIDPNIYGTLIVNTNTDETPEPLYGSFTLSDPKNVRIIGSKMINPLSFIRSDISLFKAPNISNNLLIPYFSCPPFPNSGMCNIEQTLSLEPGIYYYSMNKNLDAEYFPPGTPISGFASIKIIVLEPPPSTPIPVTMQVGGVRIKSIQTNDGLGNISNKSYSYLDPSSVRTAPYYISRMNISKNITCINESTGAGETRICEPCGYEFKVHDESVVPMVGNPVEYSVTEFTGGNGNNGKTEYSFTGADNLSLNATQPYVTPFLATWRANLLLQKKIFKKENNAYTLIQQENNSYDFTNPNPPESYTLGVKADYWKYCENIGLGRRIISETQENYQTENFYPKSNTSTYFTQAGNIINSVDNTYASNSHTLQTQSAKANSKNQIIKDKIKYSFDYNTTTCNDAFSIGIKNLNNKHVLLPIENLNIKSINGLDYIIGGTLLTYNSSSTTALKVFQLKINSPVLLSTFTESYVNTTGIFIKDSRYEEKAEFNSYDAFNNVLQEHYTSNIFKSYIWDYNNLYLTTECLNAERNNIAATSFEADGTNTGWSIPSPLRDNTTAITGSKSYSLFAGAITKSQLDIAKTYIVSYWSKVGAQNVNGTNGIAGRSINGWVYYEHKVSNPSSGIITVSGFATIDELRLYPDKAQMSTYTYRPLIGITSQCDANNKISFYEYDSFNRLTLIRDQDNNILKKICYNYAGQVEDCPLQVINSNPQWVATGNTRCQKCPSNNAYNTGVKEKEEKDMNILSATVGALRWVVDLTGTCPVAAWTATGNTRCQPCPSDANYNSGIREKEEKDLNPCSPTYTSAPRWVIDPSSTCPVLPNYQPNSTPVCQQNNGVNSGYLITTTVDINPCSNPPGQAGPPILTPSAACIPCSPACAEPQYHCINGVCVQGVWKVIKVQKISKNTWQCTRVWCYPNSGSMDPASTYSTYSQTTTSTTACAIECF
jgi:hypothetical protein